jgi:cell wall assembly regulator SMI1
MVRDALTGFEAELKRRAPGIAAALHPGLDGERVTALLADFPHQVPAELRELYTWHDGTEEVSGGRAELFPGGRWLPLADALTTWADAMEANRQEGQAIWDPRWLPLTTDGRDGYHAVACGSGDGRIVAFFFVDLPDGWWLEHAGLTAMIEKLTRRWTHGVYWQTR